MDFNELFDTSRYPKGAETVITKPKYQFSAEEYNALTKRLKGISDEFDELEAMVDKFRINNVAYDDGYVTYDTGLGFVCEDGYLNFSA